MVLGQVPPRISGIKVYDENTSRTEIIMDLDLVILNNFSSFTGLPVREKEYVIHEQRTKHFKLVTYRRHF